jgi:hypothetical protein
LKPGVFKGLKGFSALQVFSFTSDRRLSIQEVKGLARWPRLHTILINKVPLNRAVVEHLRQSSSSSHWRLGVDIAYAAGVSDEQVEAILEVASLPKSADSARERIGGLPLIHETESSLNEVVAAPSMMGVDNVQNDEKNFLGDFTVGSGVPAKKPKRGERKMEVAQ